MSISHLLPLSSKLTLLCTALWYWSWTLNTYLLCQLVLLGFFLQRELGQVGTCHCKAVAEEEVSLPGSCALYLHSCQWCLGSLATLVLQTVLQIPHRPLPTNPHWPTGTLVDWPLDWQLLWTTCGPAAPYSEVFSHSVDRCCGHFWPTPSGKFLLLWHAVCSCGSHTLSNKVWI